MNRFYQEVAERSRYRCDYCKAPERVSNVAFEVEHIIPVAAGGTDHLDNLCLACRSCNQFKSDQTALLDPDTGMIVSLFHPNRDQWEAHFDINLSGAEIIGKTAIGRVTVACLQMNRRQAITARRLWIAFQIFP